jgi:cell division protein ZapA (FtsZ GTPase activity inhibitor)
MDSRKQNDTATATGDRQVVAVRIAGHEYKIRSEGDADGLRKIAGYVDQAMATVRQRTGTVDTLDVSVLTSLNLAREILTLRAERPSSVHGRANVDEQQIQMLIKRVEGALVGATDEDVEGSETPAEEQERSIASPRTLELPSVESLQNRVAENTVSELESDEDHLMPEARVAFGGRDRAS